ncbi:MAG TPA: polyprenyl synthetase family protein [Gemmataceae bacterium]|nr:polyprenyl synthetase family protein [Gemmataceae bacterium]
MSTPTAPVADAPKAKKPSTSHLKNVPQERPERDRIRAEAARFAAPLDRSRPMTKAELQKLGENLLARLGLDEQYLGFAMVSISNEFWREQLTAIDFSRRLLLLPHCLKHAEGCPADYDEFGLDCRKCGACSVADFQTKAEDLGYKVLVAEGSPIVLKIIVSGHIDAIVGVACLNVLEKAIDKVLMAGVPSIAIPLLSSDCKNTSVDLDVVMEAILLRSEPPKAKTRSFVPLMRAANKLFEVDLERLAPRSRSKDGADHVARTEQIAYDWLGQGGKRSRPFITLAAYDAMKGAPGTFGEDRLQLPDGVCRAAMAIEAFHKASLIHDDIEDDDSFRYGRETLHRAYGVPSAVNLGDYLIGMGYRLVGRSRAELGGDCTADISTRLSEAHLKLSEGQGAELFWRDAADKALTALDTLKIYALKTAPAFEAALYAGLRLAGPCEAYEKMVVEFSRHLGVAFQILNDLKDWDGDGDNKLVAGQDALAARPTLLLALALEAANPEERAALLRILGQTNRDRDAVEKIQSIYESTQVFAKAEKLVEKYRSRAEAVADAVEPVELRELLYFLVDSVLERPAPIAEPSVVDLIQIGGR